LTIVHYTGHHDRPPKLISKHAHYCLDKLFSHMPVTVLKSSRHFVELPGGEAIFHVLIAKKSNKFIPNITHKTHLSQGINVTMHRNLQDH